jgi:hypothetical protein
MLPKHIASGSSLLLLVLGLLLSSRASAVTLPFHSTSTPAAWRVSTNSSNIDGSIASFLTDTFDNAVQISGRLSDEVGWIANNSTGTNSPGFRWTQFVFRQQFDLNGYDPSTAILSFQWAGDDSGEGYALRGSWVPKYRLNSGDLVNGSWPTTSTYALGLVTTLTDGFIDGVNTIDFYVQGNGVTDGFALRSLGLNLESQGPPDPVPGPLSLFGVASGTMYSRKLRRRIKAYSKLSTTLRR